MAGGRFDKNVGKIRPGTYVNFDAKSTDDIAMDGTRGTAIVPIIKSTYGPAGKWLMLTNASPDACMAELGYSVYDDDENRQMLLLREALKNAVTVYAYILTEGGKASGINDNMNATAKYGGTRGNQLTVTVTANVVDGYDVKVSLAGNTMELFEGIETMEDLAAAGSQYIDFTGEGELVEIAALNLSGGSDKEATNDDVAKWMDAWDGIKFNTACFPIDDDDLKKAAASKVLYMRDSMGKGVQVVMPDYSADFEGVINVTNAVMLENDVELTHAEACAWVAGATAGASFVQSNTYKEYDGAVEIVDPKTNEEAELADQNGEFFFSISEAGAVVVEYDVNSLVTFGDGKDYSYSKNRVIRVFDTFLEYVQENFPPNKFNNNSTDWDAMEGVGKSLLKLFEDAGAIQDVDYDTDFLVDREASNGTQTFFNVGLFPVDSAEKLFFSVTTRS